MRLLPALLLLIALCSISEGKEPKDSNEYTTETKTANTPNKNIGKFLVLFHFKRPVLILEGDQRNKLFDEIRNLKGIRTPEFLSTSEDGITKGLLIRQDRDSDRNAIQKIADILSKYFQVKFKPANLTQ